MPGKQNEPLDDFLRRHRKPQVPLALDFVRARSESLPGDGALRGMPAARPIDVLDFENERLPLPAVVCRVVNAFRQRAFQVFAGGNPPMSAIRDRTMRPYMDLAIPSVNHGAGSASLPEAQGHLADKNPGLSHVEKDDCCRYPVA